MLTKQVDTLASAGESESDWDLFRQVVKSHKTPADLIPEDIEAARLWDFYLATAEGIEHCKRSLNRLYPMMGRILLLVQGRPHLYKGLGFDKWDEFLDEYIWKNIGISRSEVFELTRQARNLIGISADVLETLPQPVACLISKAVEFKLGRRNVDVEMKQEVANHWVQMAGTLNSKELQKAIESEYQLDPGSLKRVVFSFSCTAAQQEFLRAFIMDARFQAFCRDNQSGADPASMFCRAIEEAMGEWSCQIENALQGQTH